MTRIPPLVDSHCHLDMLAPRKQGGDIESVVRDAAGQGVTHFLCVGVNLHDYSAMRELVEPCAQVSVSVGVHPSATPEAEPAAVELVRLADDSRVVAIGETGLDYHYDRVPRELQQQRLRTHIRAARECGKPLIIHTRAARADTLRILREEGAAEVGGVLHCFTEDWDTASAAMELGFYISFSGIVTFRNADDLRAVARRVPAERLLIETDAPYLAPAPYRGKENTPAYVRYVAEKLAEVRDEPLAAVADTTSGNFFNLFRTAKKD